MTDVEDINKMQEAVIRGGISNKERRKIWRYFLNIPPDFIPTIVSSFHHPDCKQVELDAQRSYFQITDPDLQKHKRQQLVIVIMNILERHKDLSYYQGFHCIAINVLRFAREPLAMLFLERLALGPLFPHFLRNLDGLSSINRMIYSLIKLLDEELFNFFEIQDIDPSAFTTSYIISWFTETTSNIDDVFHLLDFFIICNPIMPMYTLVAILLDKKESLMRTKIDDLFEMLSKLTTGIEIDKIIHNSIEIYQKYPPLKIFQLNPTLKVSKNLTFLNPRVDYPFPFPQFPTVSPIPYSLYQARIENVSRFGGLLSFLRKMKEIGYKILDF